MMTTSQAALTSTAGASSLAVAARGLSKVFGSGSTAVHAVRHVDLDIERSRFTAIMGPSGSGKSTLLHLLAGLDSATSGTVHVGEAELGELDDDELTRLRRDRVGFVFQAFNLVPTLTAAENIRLPLDLAGRRPDQVWWDAAISAVGIQDRLDHRPGEMSGGQCQRVAIARALITRPEVIFADEPTGNLDSVSGAGVLRVLRDAVSVSGQTVVMVTHDPVAAAHADRVLVMGDGQVRHDLDAPPHAAIVSAVTRAVA